MGIRDRLAAAQEWSSRCPSLLTSPPARSQLMAFRATRSMAGRHCCCRCSYLGVAGGYTGMDCETQAVGSGGLLSTISQTSQVCYECAAISKGCLFHPYVARLTGFLNQVRTTGNQMSTKLYSEEAGAILTCEFLSFATCSLAKRDGNISVVCAQCFFIQIRVDITGCDAAVTCGATWCFSGSTWYNAYCPNKGDKTAKHTLAIGFGGKEDADITKAKPKDECMFSSDTIVIVIAGRLFKHVFKSHLARETSGLMVKHEPSLKFYNMLKVEFLDPHKQTLKFMKDDMILAANIGGSSNARKKIFTDVPSMQPPRANKFFKSDCPDDKMIAKVPGVKQSLISSKVDAKLGISGSLLHSTKAGIPLLRVHVPSWLWLFFLVILLSTSGVNAAKESPRQGNCRYDLTSVATFSCVHPRAWKRPSKMCCKALLHAIDHVPPSGESGACCLCRYMRGKHHSSKLVRAYVLCKGKDSGTVAKWPSSITSCGTACKRISNSSPNKGVSAHKDHPVVHGTSNGIMKILWIAAAAVILMGLICFWYFWKFKPAVKAREHSRRLLQEVDPQGGRRQSSARSSAQLKGRKVATSRSSTNR